MSLTELMVVIALLGMVMTAFTSVMASVQTGLERQMNRTSNPQVSAFTLDKSQTTFGNRIVKIVILSNQNTKSGQTVEVDDSVTGRDTEFGYPVNVCNDIPPYS